MKVGRPTSYGILALGYIARHKDKPLIPSHDIAKQYKIPMEYLFKILEELAESGILHSKRGPGGGYRFAKPLKNISMLDVIEAVEGPMKCNLKVSALARGEKFGSKAEAACKKAVEQTKVAFKKIKMADIL